MTSGIKPYGNIGSSPRSKAMVESFLAHSSVSASKGKLNNPGRRLLRCERPIAIAGNRHWPPDYINLCYKPQRKHVGNAMLPTFALQQRRQRQQCLRKTRRHSSLRSNHRIFGGVPSEAVSAGQTLAERVHSNLGRCPCFPH